MSDMGSSLGREDVKHSTACPYDARERLARDALYNSVRLPKELVSIVLRYLGSSRYRWHPSNAKRGFLLGNNGISGNEEVGGLENIVAIRMLDGVSLYVGHGKGSVRFDQAAWAACLAPFSPSIVEAMDWHGGDGRVCALAYPTFAEASPSVSIVVVVPDLGTTSINPRAAGWEVGVVLAPPQDDDCWQPDDPSLSAEQVVDSWIRHVARGRRHHGRRRPGDVDQSERIGVATCSAPQIGTGLVLGTHYSLNRFHEESRFTSRRYDCGPWTRSDLQSVRVDINVSLTEGTIHFAITPHQQESPCQKAAVQNKTNQNKSDENAERGGMNKSGQEEDMMKRWWRIEHTYRLDWWARQRLPNFVPYVALPIADHPSQWWNAKPPSPSSATILNIQS